MKKTKMTKVVSVVLALAFCLCFSAGLCAGEIDASGGAATAPVNLSSTDDGTLDGNPAATALSVTVPTALPMAMSVAGDVTTATDCAITNNSYGAVRVSSVTISVVRDWDLTAFGDKSTLANEKVDANKLGFVLSVGGGNLAKTDSSNVETQTLISAPIDGCYMTGVGDPSGNVAEIDYAAIVTPLSTAVTNATIANVVFVVEWDTAA